MAEGTDSVPGRVDTTLRFDSPTFAAQRMGHPERIWSEPRPWGSGHR